MTRASSPCARRLQTVCSDASRAEIEAGGLAKLANCARREDGPRTAQNWRARRTTISQRRRRGRRSRAARCRSCSAQSGGRGSLPRAEWPRHELIERAQPARRSARAAAVAVESPPEDFLCRTIGTRSRSQSCPRVVRRGLQDAIAPARRRRRARAAAACAGSRDVAPKSHVDFTRRRV
jgi:hypothetical protein